MIDAARVNHPGAAYLVNDGRSLPVADASFDVALLFAVLTCVPSDDAQKNLVAEFKRVLRPGGLLLISDYPLQTDARNLARYAEFERVAGGYGIFQLPDGVTLRHHRRAWFEELLAGFRIEESRELQVLTMNGNPARILQLWARTPGEPDGGR
jgi:SAM-dependent methyltransferase